jgi:hypothetical protein
LASHRFSDLMPDAALMAGGGRAKIARQHAPRQTHRARALAALFDPNSFTEFGLCQTVRAT